MKHHDVVNTSQKGVSLFNPAESTLARMHATDSSATTVTAYTEYHRRHPPRFSLAFRQQHFSFPAWFFSSPFQNDALASSMHMNCSWSQKVRLGLRLRVNDGWGGSLGLRQPLVFASGDFAHSGFPGLILAFSLTRSVEGS